MKIFTALPGTYFDAGTEADFVNKVDNLSAVFFGLRNGKFDEAVCRYKEFKVKYLPDKDARSIGGHYADQEYD